MDINALISAALAEDIGPADVTTAAVIPPSLQATGAMVVQVDGVICGLDIARQVFHAVDPTLQWQALHVDGEAVIAETVVGVVTGAAQSILQAERVALNFVQHLSGIATLTRRFVTAVHGTRAQILDTRKTLPGWRALEKAAVVKGGGNNHRFGLYDRYLIKSNHIELNGALPTVCEQLAAHRRKDLLLEIEARNLDEAMQAVAGGADIVLLDNFPPADVKQTVQAIVGRAKVEVSGGINLHNIRAYAETGVDYISVGALTHSAPALDMHLVIHPLPASPEAPPAR